MHSVTKTVAPTKTEPAMRVVHPEPSNSTQPTPPLYILAASHELSSLSPSAARTLLQRGIRLNGESVEMWREYVRMEMGFVEGMRRRWGVLGIRVGGGGEGEGVGEGGEGKEGEKGMDVDGEEKEKDEMVLDVEKEDEDEEGEEARRAIMNGQIIKSVISSAAQGS